MIPFNEKSERLIMPVQLTIDKKKIENWAS